MQVSVECPRCKKLASVDARCRGTIIRCPSCKEDFMCWGDGVPHQTDGCKQNLLFRCLIIILALYGVLGWEIMLISFKMPPILVFSIFVALAIACVTTYKRAESNIHSICSSSANGSRDQTTNIEKGSEGVNEKMEFLRHLMFIAARLAKADGKVDKCEVDVAERIFGIYDVPLHKWEQLKDTFNDAMRRNDGLSVYQHAECIAQHLKDSEARLFIYDFLWDIACADGILALEEKKLLKDICHHLRIDPIQFKTNYSRREKTFDDQEEVGKKERTNTNDHTNNQSEHDDYAIIGCTSIATDGEVKAAFRKIAKSYHPDILRANNVPEDLIAIANRKMVAINEAWERIRRCRKI